MKAHSIKDIDKIKKLYKTSNQDKIKLAFGIFEKSEWTLSEIIEFILKNHKTEVFNDHIKGIDSRSFYIGSVFFNFRVIEDWEAPDDTTYYYLHLDLELKNSENKIIKSARIKEIQTESIFDTFWGMGENDFLSFTKKMDECFNKVVENIDISKTQNLYNYIYNFYSDFIDKLNNKEISLYK